MDRAGSPLHTAESGSLSCGLSVRLRLLSTPPRGDAVTFSYMCRDFTWRGLPLADKAYSRTHSPRRKPGSTEAVQ